MKPPKTVSARVLLGLLLCGLLFSGCYGAKKVRILERADRYFKAGEYDKAKVEYLTLLRMDPDRSNVTALQRLGSIWLEQGAPLEAYPYLLKARRLAPENLDVRTNLARVLAFLGANAEAKEEAMVVLQRSPADEDALLVLIDTIGDGEEVEEVKKRLRQLPEGNEFLYHLAWANLAARAGDLAYAQNELETALRLSPRSARTHLSMANLYSLEGDQIKAQEELSIAARLSPARSTARLKYAEFEKQVGKPQESTRILQEVTRQAPDYLPAWCMLAEIALSQAKFDEALSLLENVLSRDPTNREGLLQQARAELGRGETTKALKQLKQLAQTYPHSAQIDYHLARAYLADGNLDSAAAALDDAIAVQPNDVEAILLRGELDLRRGNAPPVISGMLKLLEKQPGSVPARLLLAQSYRASGRLDDAAAAIRVLLDTSNASADAYLRLGQILLEQKKMDEARDAFEHALKLAPASLETIEQIVDLDLLEKKFAGAMQRVEQHFTEARSSSWANYLKGKIYVAEGQWDQAAAALHRALEGEPNFSRAVDLLVSTYLAANKLKQASDELQRFLAKNPNNVSILARVAQIYTRMKDYPKARNAYEKLLSVSPRSSNAMNNLAYLYVECLNEPDKAYEVARKARALAPNDPLIADTLGWTLYKKAEYQQALTLFQESARKLPDNPDVQFHLGLASYMMADQSAAREAFGRALSTRADFSGRAEAQRRFAFLQNGPNQELSLDQLKALPEPRSDDVLAWIRLGAAYETHGAFMKAAGAYEKALQINSRLLLPAVKLAELYEGPLQNSKRAIEFAKQARDLAPNDPHVAGLLGGIAYRMGNVHWAYSLLQESARTLNSDAKILHDYAWAAYTMGKVSEATQAMKRILELQPESRTAADANSFVSMVALGQDPVRLAASEPEIEKILAADSAYLPALMAKAIRQAQRGDTKAAIVIYNDILRRYPDFAPAQKELASLPAQESRGQ